jgi:hypothetical protein
MCQACTGAAGTCVNQAAGNGNLCHANTDMAGPGNYCDGSGHCVAQLGIGGVCTQSYQCINGRCVDGHCCSVASCGTCQQCSSGGSCINVAAGMQPTNGTCKATGMVCDGNGTCSKGYGAACANNSDCFNGICADGVCCNDPCTAQCQYCDATGTCVQRTGSPLVNPGGVSPLRGDCSGKGTPCYGTCDATGGTNGCDYPGASTSCVLMMGCTPGSAANPARVKAGTCNTGMCVGGSNQNCGTIAGTIATIKCDATKTNCLANCATDADCINTDYCAYEGAPNGQPGNCVPKRGDGFPCTAATYDDCLVSGCAICKSTSACQPSGQCCAAACATAPSCTNATTWQASFCGTGGACNTPPTFSCSKGCDSAVGLCKCTSDADCPVALFPNSTFCDSTSHCAITLPSGAGCRPSDCNQARCAECTGTIGAKSCNVDMGVCP